MQGRMVMMQMYPVLILLLLHLFRTASVEITVRGQITEDTNFYYRQLSTRVSRFAVVSFKVTIPSHFEYVNLNIYTTEEHVNIKRQCSQQKFGQVGNFHLHKELKQSHSKCQNDGNNGTTCNDTVTIQDYIARNYSFSFGFNCMDKENQSLKGFHYTVTTNSQTNKTTCSPMPDTRANCDGFYPFVTHPNLLIHTTQEDAVADFNTGFLRYPGLFNCYQPIVELNCHVYFPKCYPGNNTIVFPCRESCEEFFEACLSEVPPAMAKVFVDSYDCSYLPSITGTIPCFHRPVTCGNPPNLRHAAFQSKDENTNHYPVHSEIQYACTDSTFQMEGSNTIRCLYSGEWSEPPECVLKADIDIILGMLQSSDATPVLVFIGVVFFVRQKLKGKGEQFRLTRMRSYDAFVCYCYEKGDASFAENTVRFAFEKYQVPPFRLFIHRRDFKAGWDIMWNIRNAIQNSNSAIIVMSQDYVNSLWCKEEFDQCYFENMRDPAFKLFVIMRQPEKSLENISDYMKSFFTKNTYLHENDSNLFPKIADYLATVKQPPTTLRTDIVTDETRPDTTTEAVANEIKEAIDGSTLSACKKVGRQISEYLVELSDVEVKSKVLKTIRKLKARITSTTKSTKLTEALKPAEVKNSFAEDSAKSVNEAQEADPNESMLQFVGRKRRKIFQKIQRMLR